MGLGRSSEAFLLDPAATWTEYAAETPASKEEDIKRTLATLQERSAKAYDLAIMLASAPFTLPVARLVQEGSWFRAPQTTRSRGRRPIL